MAAGELYSPAVALGRFPERGSHDFDTVAAILDAGTMCHVGVVAGAQPIVIPSIYARVGSDLYLHGSPVAHWMRSPGNVCITVSILDGLVLARSAYQHSLNYRSVVVLGRAERVQEPQDKARALQAIVEHVCPGRWADVRQPSDSELRATCVLRVPIVEASAKIRTGPPNDFAQDLENGAWAGVIPLFTSRGVPIPDPLLSPDVRVPAYCSSEQCDASA